MHAVLLAAALARKLLRRWGWRVAGRLFSPHQEACAPCAAAQNAARSRNASCRAGFLKLAIASRGRESSDSCEMRLLPTRGCSVRESWSSVCDERALDRCLYPSRIPPPFGLASRPGQARFEPPDFVPLPARRVGRRALARGGRRRGKVALALCGGDACAVARAGDALSSGTGCRCLHSNALRIRAGATLQLPGVACQPPRGRAGAQPQHCGVRRLIRHQRLANGSKRRVRRR